MENHYKRVFSVNTWILWSLRSASTYNSIIETEFDIHAVKVFRVAAPYVSYV